MLGGPGGPSFPAGPLFALNGTLYGTSAYGGAYKSGSLFSVTPSGTVTVLHSFGKGSDGSRPIGALILHEGILYGVTDEGGKYGAGTIFSLAADGTYAIFCSFNPATDKVSNPGGALAVIGSRFFGMSYSGGTYNAGTVFAVDAHGTASTIYAFTGMADGHGGPGSLTPLNGLLYGTTEAGGSFGAGNVFAVSPAGDFTTVYSFQGGADGAGPLLGVTEHAGVLYGTTTSGGTGCGSGCGTAYSLTPAGTKTVLHDFAGGEDGSSPTSTLLRAGGYFYGLTGAGGRHNDGTAYRLKP